MPRPPPRGSGGCTRSSRWWYGCEPRRPNRSSRNRTRQRPPSPSSASRPATWPRSADSMSSSNTIRRTGPARPAPDRRRRVHGAGGDLLLRVGRHRPGPGPGADIVLRELDDGTLLATADHRHRRRAARRDRPVAGPTPQLRGSRATHRCRRRPPDPPSRSRRRSPRPPPRRTIRAGTRLPSGASPAGTARWCARRASARRWTTRTSSLDDTRRALAAMGQLLLARLLPRPRRLGASIGLVSLPPVVPRTSSSPGTTSSARRAASGAVAASPGARRGSTSRRRSSMTDAAESQAKSASRRLADELAANPVFGALVPTSASSIAELLHDDRLRHRANVCSRPAIRPTTSGSSAAVASTSRLHGAARARSRSTASIPATSSACPGSPSRSEPSSTPRRRTRAARSESTPHACEPSAATSLSSGTSSTSVRDLLRDRLHATRLQLLDLYEGQLMR